MSKLQPISVKAKAGLKPWDSIPQSRWQQIAAQCGPLEIADIMARIETLKAELLSVDASDGDTHDDINKAMFAFRGILAMTDSRPK